MTCLEKYLQEYPDSGMSAAEIINGTCPDLHDIMAEPEYCTGCYGDGLCEPCWNREIPSTEKKSGLQEAMEKIQECVIKDSGSRQEFSTGAVRDIQKGKGRCDLMPLDVVAWVLGGYDDNKDSVLDSIDQFMSTNTIGFLYDALEFFRNLWGIPTETMFLEVAKHFEDGAEKYGENNWQKGLPVKCYMNSAVRHYLKWLRGDKDEAHDRAFCWNILCAIWTCKHKPELNDYAVTKTEVPGQVSMFENGGG